VFTLRFETFETKIDLLDLLNSIIEDLKPLGIERVSVAIDEANIGYNLFHGRWESPNTHMKRGFMWDHQLWEREQVEWEKITKEECVQLIYNILSHSA